MSHQTVGHAEDKKSRAYRNLPAFPARGMDVVTLHRRPHLSHHHGTFALCEIILIPPVGCPAGGNDLSRPLFSGERLFFTFRFPAFSVPVRGAPALSSLLRFPVFYVSRPLALSCLLRLPSLCAPFLSRGLPILYNCRAR